MFVLRGTYITEYVYIDKITGFYPFSLRFPSFLFSLSNKTIFSTQPVMPQIAFNTSIYIPQNLNYTSWLYLRSFLLKVTSPSAQVTSTSFLGPAASKHSTSRSRVKERTPLLFLSNFFSIFVVFLEQKNKC